METMTETKVCAVFASHSPGGLAPKPATAIVQAVAAIASTDPARGIITGVHVKTIENGNGFDLVLSATDSYRLIRAALPNVAVAAFDPFTVPARELVQACKIAKGFSRMTWGFSSQGFTVEATDGGPVGNPFLPVPVLPGEYVNLPRIIDTVPEWCADSETALFDATLLAGLIDSCGVIAVGGRTGKNAGIPGITVKRVNPLKPARFTMIDEHTGIYGNAMLMPRRK